MAVIYLFAFASLFVQIPGLYGDNGILPVKLVLQSPAISFKDLWENQPSLLRLLPHLGLSPQASMDFLCLAGVIFSFVAMVSKGMRNTVIFAFLWAFYFSLFQVGQTFLWFQWDILLLEIGFITIFVAPFVIPFGKVRIDYHQHDKITLWLVKWLLFRLMFASGIVKLTSRCPTWWGLTALNYHYESQCIPMPAAWVLHQFPEWFHKLSVALVYLIEIILPLLFFSPVRQQRILAGFSQVLLMLMIMVTGNYNFFNLLTIVLCLSLMDDNYIRSWMGKPPMGNDEDVTKIPLVNKFWRPIKFVLNLLVYGAIVYWFVVLFTIRPKTGPLRIESKIAFNNNDLDRFLQKVVPITIWIGIISLGLEIVKAMLRSVVYERGVYRKTKNLLGCLFFGSVAVALFSISLVDHTVIETNSQRNLWPILHKWHRDLRRFEITSSYGLFRSMTGVGGRPEVIIEGSDFADKGWKEYNFLYKPGNITEKLPVVAPHQPRLDWQMWFAALGTYQHNPWFLNLVYRLFTQQKEVLELMGENPFPEKPPKYIRAVLYHYYYTRWDKKHEWYSHTDWWVRKQVREYMPVISKDDPAFNNYLKQAGIISTQKKAKDQPKDETFLPYALGVLRRVLFGRLEGYFVCMGLFITGCVLGYLDPTLKLMKERAPLK
jgi:hypothetical protein